MIGAEEAFRPENMIWKGITSKPRFRSGIPVHPISLNFEPPSHGTQVFIPSISETISHKMKHRQTPRTSTTSRINLRPDLWRLCLLILASFANFHHYRFLLLFWWVCLGYWTHFYYPAGTVSEELFIWNSKALTTSSFRNSSSWRFWPASNLSRLNRLSEAGSWSGTGALLITKSDFNASTIALTYPFTSW